MQEVVTILAEAGKQLREVEALDSFKKVTRALAAKIYLAHGGIALAQAKLHVLMTEREETCEKS